MKRIELLAPAKNLETAISAINCGADAVYIGANNFGARINASNTVENIEELVKYAHKFYVRVHVTINTILNNNELKESLKLIKKLYSIGVDAVIIQDMGILKAAIDNKIPPIQIHMSTQCNNRTLEKIKFFDNMGVTRVITARELSLKEIENICKNTKCEIETFIHGALCVSYSGQCYMSFANGGRSANRGECAQPCRKRYSLVSESGKTYFKNKYLLSLKDFNASNHLERLINAGVKSFKIEGRLKDVNYVKNITLFYNNLINKYAQRTSSGKVFTDIEPNPYKTFNRQYTEYFLDHREECYNFATPKSMGEFIGEVTRINKNSIETNTVLKLNSQDGICYMDSDELVGFKVNKTDNNIIYPNKMPSINIGTKLYRNYDNEYDKELSSEKIIRKIGIKFKIDQNKIIVRDEDSNITSIELSEISEANDPQKAKETLIKQLNKTGESDFYVQQIEFITNKIPFLPISKINEIRRNLLENLMLERIKNYPKILQKKISYTNFNEKNLDYKHNIYNDEAKNFYKNSACQKLEYALEKNKIIPENIELMRCKHCLKYAAGICSKNKKNNENLYLVDEQGKKYKLKFDCQNCEMIILS